jgi:hypothetical protein
MNMRGLERERSPEKTLDNAVTLHHAQDLRVAAPPTSHIGNGISVCGDGVTEALHCHAKKRALVW